MNPEPSEIFRLQVPDAAAALRDVAKAFHDRARPIGEWQVILDPSFAPDDPESAGGPTFSGFVGVQIASPQALWAAFLPRPRPRTGRIRILAPSFLSPSAAAARLAKQLGGRPVPTPPGPEVRASWERVVAAGQLAEWLAVTPTPGHPGPLSAGPFLLSMALGMGVGIPATEMFLRLLPPPTSPASGGVERCLFPFLVGMTSWLGIVAIPLRTWLDWAPRRFRRGDPPTPPPSLAQLLAAWPLAYGASLLLGVGFMLMMMALATAMLGQRVGETLIAAAVGVGLAGLAGGLLAAEQIHRRWIPGD